MKLDINKLQLEMARHAMGINDLAFASGLTANSISSFMSERRNPTGKSIGKMAIGLGVDVLELLVDESKKKE